MPYNSKHRVQAKEVWEVAENILLQATDKKEVFSSTETALMNPTRIPKFIGE